MSNRWTRSPRQPNPRRDEGRGRLTVVVVAIAHVLRQRVHGHAAGLENSDSRRRGKPQGISTRAPLTAPAASRGMPPRAAGLGDAPGALRLVLAPAPR